jgi:SAM-dependent methyltransferase
MTLADGVLAAMADGLIEDEPGFFVASEAGSVSYPDRAHDACFELESASWWFRHRNRCLTAAVRRYPPGGPILDIGGGNGFVSLALQAAGHDTILLEPGSDGARNAYARGLRPVIRASFEASAFRAGSLWAAGMFDVLEHIEDDRGFLDRLVSSLRPNGRLYLTVPAHAALWSSEDVDAGHHRRYGARSLTRVLGASGLETEYLTHLYWFLPAPILVLRTLADRAGLRKGGVAASRRSEYVAPSPVLDGALRALLAPEVAFARRGLRVPVGSSLLAVARRPG